MARALRRSQCSASDTAGSDAARLPVSACGAEERGGGSGRRLHALVSQPPGCPRLLAYQFQPTCIEPPVINAAAEAGALHDARGRCVPELVRRLVALGVDGVPPRFPLTYFDHLVLACRPSSVGVLCAGRSCRHCRVLSASAVGVSGDLGPARIHRSARTATDRGPSCALGPSSAG